MKITSLLFLFLLLPDTLPAASSEPVGFFLSSLKMFVAMAIVIGIMLLFHVLNRKGFKFLEKRSAGRIKILETRPVGGRKSLCLVEVRGEELLLGLGNERIDFLYHFSASQGDGRFEKELQAHFEAEK